MRMLVLWFLSVTSAWSGEGFDHTHAQFASFLGSAVSNSGIKYDDLASRRPELDAYLAQIESASLDGFGRSQKIAFWVNAYNALTLALILDEKQPKSILDLDGGKVWDTRKYAVAGQQLTLNDIEHRRARPLTDGRIHGALNCASKGCPPLGPKPMRASGIDAQLDQAAKRWVATNAFAKTGDSVAVSHIFKWFADDFKKWAAEPVPGVGTQEGAALRFIAQFGGEAEQALTAGNVTVTYNPYDWTLNRR